MQSHNTISPPKLWLRFFRWFCRPEYAEDIEGDLIERFDRRVESEGPKKAKKLFIKDVVKLFKPGLIKKIEGNRKLNNYGMFKNYFKTARRNLVKQKMYSSIKIGGFALGIAACILITLFIRDELSYDQHYQHQDQLYRVYVDITYNDDRTNMAWLPAPYARTLITDYPEVEVAGRFNSGGLFGAGTNQIRTADKVQNSLESGFAYADSEMLELLEIPMRYGDPDRALKEANTIVLSKRKADKFFPGINPIGQLMIINENEGTPLRVDGVIDDSGHQSHFQYDFLVSLTGKEFWKGEQNYWSANNYPTYVRLKENVDPRLLEPKLDAMATKYILPTEQREGNVNAEEFVSKIHYHLQPIGDVHLRSADILDPYEHGDINVVWLFGIIAFVILLIAVINFINLSTAKSANRAKEIGLRKTIGSLKKDLVSQFLVESTLFSLLSFGVGLLLTSMLLPYFNEMAGKTLTLPYAQWWFIPILISSSLVIGILAGIYPAFYLSSFRPIQVLKGNVSLGAKKSGLRSALVAFQFCTSAVLIITTLVVSRQMTFILNKDIGFDKDQVVLLKGTNTLGDGVEVLKNQVLSLPGVENATIGNYLPVSGALRDGNLFWKDGTTKTEEGIGAQMWYGDKDYVMTLGMTIVEGRDFSSDLKTDSSSVLINEKLVEFLGLRDPVGKKITTGWAEFTIIGVLKDFHFESLKGNIQGVCIALGNENSVMAVRTKSEDMTQTVQSISEIWDELVPQQNLSMDFMDQRYAAMYEDTERTGRIFKSFSILAIAVACLGLFALSVFMVEQRQKEISIRLVLGAKMSHVLRSLGFNFIKPVVIALLLAIPFAWYVMRDWLSNFEYGIGLSWDIFLVAGLATILISLITISYQTIKAGLLKPVDGLRNE